MISCSSFKSLDFSFQIPVMIQIWLWLLRKPNSRILLNTKNHCCCACAGLRPERPVICDDDCWQLMQRCWDGNANSRPHIGELEQALRSIHRQSSALPQTFAAALQHDGFANLNGHSFAATSYQDTLSILQWLKFARHYFAMLVR